jgi:hypothetical protein
MYEPTSTTYSASSDEALIAEAIENLPADSDRHHTIVQLEDQTVCLSVARAPADDECWGWFAAAAGERAELTSDRLLPLVSAGNFDGWFYVAHDIGAAVPLSEYRRVSDLSTQRALALLLGIAHGLDEAVRQGKPPSEVTPDSVFLDPRMGAMVGDLGVAREALGNPPSDRDPHAAWVAPEVLLGDGAHPRSAVYSFGAIAYTLLTGRPPHSGEAQQIAQARAPRISEERPDLPATLDTVFAVAMAHEPSKRYATAAEARHLLNLVMYGAPTVPALEASPRFRRGNGTPKAGPPAAPVARIRPLVEDNPRRGQVVVGLLVAGAVAAGAAFGAVAAGGDSGAPAQAHAAAAGMTLELPNGWRQEPARAGQLAASPVGDQKSGLLISVSHDPVSRADQAAPVLLGTYQAWRHEATAAAGGARATRYVIPTRSGQIDITCTAGGGATSTLALCERTASTLHVDGRHTLGLIQVVANHQRWRALTLKLQTERAAGRRSLAAADKQTGQIVAAKRLAALHDRAARRFAKLNGGAASAKAAREVAAAYRALATAARGDSPSAWTAARSSLSSSEASLQRAVAAG